MKNMIWKMISSFNHAIHSIIKHKILKIYDGFTISSNSMMMDESKYWSMFKQLNEKQRLIFGNIMHRKEMYFNIPIHIFFSLVLPLGSKRVILFLAFKNQIPCCDTYHHSHSLKKSNNCPQTITSFPVLSWNPAVLWGFWTNQNQWFFHSDFFSHTQNRGCLVLISSNTQKPARWVWISQPPAIGVYYEKSNAHTTLDFKPYFICTPIWRDVNSHIGKQFHIWKST
jgi:hypothetical protein